MTGLIITAVIVLGLAVVAIGIKRWIAGMNRLH